MVRGNPVGDFNTAGQEKCPYCGSYVSEMAIYSHMGGCSKNPANQEEEED